MMLRLKEIKQIFLNLLLLLFYLAVFPFQLSAEGLETGYHEVLLQETSTEFGLIDLPQKNTKTFTSSSLGRSLYFANEVFADALKVREIKQAAKATSRMGVLYLEAGIPDSAAYFFKKLFTEFSYHTDDYNRGIGYKNLGTAYLTLNDWDNAAQSFRKALEALDGFRRLNDSLPLPGISDIYNNLGLIFSVKQDYPSALANYEKGIALARTTPGEKRIYARLLNNYGRLLTLMGDKKKAIENLQKSLEIRLELEDISGTIASYQNIGFYYARQNDNRNAILYTTKAFIMASNFNFLIDVYQNASFLHSLYFKMGMADSAIRYQDIAKTHKLRAESYEAALQLQKQQLLKEMKLLRHNQNMPPAISKWQPNTIIFLFGSFVFVATLILILRKQFLKDRESVINYSEKAFTRQNHKYASNH